MADNPLQAQPSANENSAPAAEVNKPAEEGEINSAPNEAEKVEGQEGEGQSKPEPTEADKVRQAMQKRIDRQTAASKARDERIRQLDQQVRDLQATAPKVEDAPKEADFESWDDWQKATIEYQAKKQAEGIVKAQKEKELGEQRAAKDAEVRKEFAQKETTFRTTNPDYDQFAAEAVETVKALGETGAQTQTLLDAVMEFDNPPEMIYQLGKDTSLIEQLVGLSPLKLMRELVKFEAAFKSTVKEPREEAPEPIKPTSAKGGVKPIHERSGKEIMAWLKNK